MAAYVYPDDLLARLPVVWNASRGFGTAPLALPGNDELRILFNVAYYASLLAEEQRRPGFRLV
jgi:hypothetical protein